MATDGAAAQNGSMIEAVGASAFAGLAPSVAMEVFLLTRLHPTGNLPIQR